MLVCSGESLAQQFMWARKNNPYYDEKRKVSYGFIIGLHTAAYEIKYSDAFVTGMDSLFSVEPDWRPGFALGFLVNYRAHEFLDLRIMPQVAFYENILTYRYTDETSRQELVESTVVELPVLVKYKSMRRGNIRMYMVGGLKPGIEASGQRNVENVTDRLEITSFNLNVDAGIGFDLYFPLFKFSPEIRFSRGLLNQLDNTTNPYGKPLKSVTTNTISFNMIFQ
ncbi:MAG: PorT family protein [Cyclobacteriaceae bacterium]|nr:PorT family protein [Cyclobacteriaceae bacterium]